MLTTATETFTGPSLADLITQAEHGKNESQAISNRMLTALQTQLEAGPLADLSSGAVTPDSPIAEAQYLELSFEQNVAQQLMSKSATRTDRLLGRLGEVLDLDGRRVVANLVSLYQQDSALVINNDELTASSQAVVSSLTAGPIHPLGTSLSGLASTTSAIEAELATLARDLAEGVFTLDPGGPAMMVGSAPTPTEILHDQLVLTAGLNKTTQTLDAELESYRASVQAATRFGSPAIATQANAAIDKLEAAVSGLNQDNLATAEAQLNASLTTFDASVSGKTGLFAPRGAYSRAPKTVNLHANSTANLAPSAVGAVSGVAGLTSTTNGTATLTATLQSANNSPIAGQTIDFTIDGNFAGSAVTNSEGVATLSGLTTSDASGSRTSQGVTINSNGVVVTTAGDTSTGIENFGTQTGVIVATFGGNSQFLSSQGRGDLVVGNATTPGSL